MKHLDLSGQLAPLIGRQGDMKDNLAEILFLSSLCEAIMCSPGTSRSPLMF